MVDKKAVGNMYDDAEVFQSSILEARQAEHAAEIMAAEERARAHRKQKKVRFSVEVGENRVRFLELGRETCCEQGCGFTSRVRKTLVLPPRPTPVGSPLRSHQAYPI